MWGLAVHARRQTATRNLSSRYAYGLRLLRFRSNQRKPPPWCPSLENEGGSAHPWARDYRCLLRSAAKVRPLGGRGTLLRMVGGIWHHERNFFPLKSIAAGILPAWDEMSIREICGFQKTFNEKRYGYDTCTQALAGASRRRRGSAGRGSGHPPAAGHNPLYCLLLL